MNKKNIFLLFATFSLSFFLFTQTTFVSAQVNLDTEVVEETISLTEEEKEWIKEHPVIIAGHQSNICSDGVCGRRGI